MKTKSYIKEQIILKSEWKKKNLNKPTWLKSFSLVNDNIKNSNKTFIGKTKSGKVQKLNSHKILKQNN